MRYESPSSAPFANTCIDCAEGKASACADGTETCCASGPAVWPSTLPVSMSCLGDTGSRRADEIEDALDVDREPKLLILPDEVKLSRFILCASAFALAAFICCAKEVLLGVTFSEDIVGLLLAK